MTRETLGAAALPASYTYLKRPDTPEILAKALNHYGVKEYPGSADNRTILGWRDELLLAYPHLSWIKDVIEGDATPWCGLFMAYIAHQAGYGAPHRRFLTARSWAEWPFGLCVLTNVARLGDILVFWRGSRDGQAGHVGLYVGEDDTHFHVLGGNQTDSVSITRIARTRLLRVVRPVNVSGQRRVIRTPDMADITDNEA